MKRTALATFFHRAILAALPLVGGLAGSGCGSPVQGRITGGTTVTGGSTGGCGATWVVDGGLDDGGCYERCAQPQLGRYTSACTESTNDGGGVVTQCEGQCGTGRRPEGMRQARVRGGALGAHFARMAHLEAASVPAFRRLRAELRAHGAPQRLLDRCTRAARDEVRHARVAARLAKRFGARPPKVVLPPLGIRPLDEVALENAREGCVRESFGALYAGYQARMAGDPEVRAVLRQIAADETRHAELAWAVDAWVRTRLDAAALARMESGKREALDQLASEVVAPFDAELARLIGLPPPAAGRALHAAFAGEVARRAV
jgi:hypothetical protein